MPLADWHNSHANLSNLLSRLDEDPSINNILQFDFTQHLESEQTILLDQTK